MERHFSFDFSQVRIHTDARSAESAQRLNAHAYTVGRDIVYLGRSAYRRAGAREPRAEARQRDPQSRECFFRLSVHND
jgi:Domain of unknown function (DUF4157)